MAASTSILIAGSILGGLLPDRGLSARTIWVHPRVIGPSDTIRLSQKGGFALNVTIHCKSHPNVTDFALGSYRICPRQHHRSEEHTSELQSLMRTYYAVFCLKKKRNLTK